MGCSKSKHAVATENVIKKKGKNNNNNNNPPVKKPDVTAGNEVKENGGGIWIENNGGVSKPRMARNNTGVGVGVVDDKGEVHGVIQVGEDFNGNTNYNDVKSSENQNLKVQDDVPIQKKTDEVVKVPEIPEEEPHAKIGKIAGNDQVENMAQAQVNNDDILKIEDVVVSQHPSSADNNVSLNEKALEPVISGKSDNDASGVKGDEFQDKVEGNEAKKEDVLVSQDVFGEDDATLRKQDLDKTSEAVVVSGHSENDAKDKKADSGEDNSGKGKEKAPIIDDAMTNETISAVITGEEEDKNAKTAAAMKGDVTKAD